MNNFSKWLFIVLLGAVLPNCCLYQPRQNLKCLQQRNNKGVKEKECKEHNKDNLEPHIKNVLQIMR